MIYINKNYYDFYDKNSNLKEGEYFFDEFYYYEVADISTKAVVDDYLFYRIYELNLIYSDDLDLLKDILEENNISYTLISDDNQSNLAILYGIILGITLFAFLLNALFLNIDIGELFEKDKDYVITLRCLGVSRKSLIKHYYLQIIKKTMFSIILGLLFGLLVGLYLQKFNTVMKYALLINPFTVLLSYLIGIIIISLSILLFISLKLRHTAATLKRINKF